MRSLRGSLWHFDNSRYDRGAFGGIALAVGLILAGIALGGEWSGFLDLPSLLIVVGGTVGAALVQFSPSDLSRAGAALQRTLQSSSIDHLERIHRLVQLSQQVRKDGMLVLEQAARRSADPFFSKGLQLAADGQSAADTRRMLEIELRSHAEQATRGVAVFEAMGTYAPAMGLIGTLIGLIQMLSALDNPEKIGPAMAVALVTTFYGSILANLILLPFAGKIRLHAEQELLVRTVTIEGIESLIVQENPLLVEQRLQGFLPAVAHG